MVGYNVGGGGGSSGGNNHRDDTAKPDMVLEGYTFHAGESEEQQVGRIKNFDGKAVSGKGNGSQAISVSTSVRYIPAGTYLAEDVMIAAPALESRTRLDIYGSNNYVPAGRYTQNRITPRFASTNASFGSWAQEVEFDLSFEPKAFLLIMDSPDDYGGATDDYGDVYYSIFYDSYNGVSSAAFQWYSGDDNLVFCPDATDFFTINGTVVRFYNKTGKGKYYFQKNKTYWFYAWA